MILNADDFGLSPSVNKGILELLEMKKISSVSCMVTIRPDLESYRHLRKYKNEVDIGLHLVLTDHTPITDLQPLTNLVNSRGHFLSFKELTLNTYTKKISLDALKKEILAQVQSFTELTGQPPDFIDGHQHIQQLPQIRTVLCEVASQLQTIKYIRCAKVPFDFLVQAGIKTSSALALGNLALMIPALGLQTELNKFQLKSPRYLLGYYNHHGPLTFETIFKSYTTRFKIEKRDLFFFHPGYVDAELKRLDSSTDLRVENLNFIKSREFERICQNHNIELSRF